MWFGMICVCRCLHTNTAPITAEVECSYRYVIFKWIALGSKFGLHSHSNFAVGGEISPQEDHTTYQDRADRDRADQEWLPERLPGLDLRHLGIVRQIAHGHLLPD